MKRILTLALAALMILALVSCGSEPVVKVVEIELTQEEYAFGVDKDQPELLQQVNDFLDKIMENGTFDEICNKYFADGTPTPVNQLAQISTPEARMLVITPWDSNTTKDIEKIDKLISIGARFQINAEPFLTFSGKRIIRTLAAEGLISAIGSDCHGVKRRSPDISYPLEIFAKKFGDAFIDYLYNKSEKPRRGSPPGTPAPGASPCTSDSGFC